MPKLIYTVVMSLDGYIADKNGNFNWAEPDEEVHSFVNELARGDGTYLYGRRMYEVMAVWQTLPTHDQPSFIADFANIWRAADKVVYSKTLKTASTPRTHIEQHFEPRGSSADESLGGTRPRRRRAYPRRAHAFKAGLVDVCRLFIAPIIVGGGTSAFPSGVRLELALQDERLAEWHGLLRVPSTNKPSCLTNSRENSEVKMNLTMTLTLSEIEIEAFSKSIRSLREASRRRK